jgi:anti-sigma-K factor RskA
VSADIHGLSGAYAVDAVSDDERAAFEAHLAECDECRAEVASLREAAAGLAPLSDTAPPPQLRDAVLQGISGVRPLPPAETNVVPLASRRRRTVAWVAAAAAAVALIVGGIAWNASRTGTQPTLTATEQVLRAGDAQRYEKSFDGARATIVRSPSLHKAVIVADNLPSPPAGKDYQLWLALPGQGLVSAGLMPHGGEPTVTMLLEGDASQATGAGITVEPAGGSTKPTTPPLALFAFS